MLSLRIVCPLWGNLFLVFSHLKLKKTENHLLSASLKTRAFLSLSTESNSFDYKECGWFSST